jgi:hypothetical protein
MLNRTSLRTLMALSLFLFAGESIAQAAFTFAKEVPGDGVILKNKAGKMAVARLTAGGADPEYSLLSAFKFDSCTTMINYDCIVCHHADSLHVFSTRNLSGIYAGRSFNIEMPKTITEANYYIQSIGLRKGFIYYNPANHELLFEYPKYTELKIENQTFMLGYEGSKLTGLWPLVHSSYHKLYGASMDYDIKTIEKVVLNNSRDASSNLYVISNGSKFCFINDQYDYERTEHLSTRKFSKFLTLNYSFDSVKVEFSEKNDKVTQAAFIKVKEGNKWAYCDLRTPQISETIYDDIRPTPFDYRYVLLKVNGKWGVHYLEGYREEKNYLDFLFDEITPEVKNKNLIGFNLRTGNCVGHKPNQYGSSLKSESDLLPKPVIGDTTARYEAFDLYTPMNIIDSTQYKNTFSGNYRASARSKKQNKYGLIGFDKQSLVRDGQLREYNIYIHLFTGYDDIPFLKNERENIIQLKSGTKRGVAEFTLNEMKAAVVIPTIFDSVSVKYAVSVSNPNSSRKYFAKAYLNNKIFFYDNNKFGFPLEEGYKDVQLIFMDTNYTIATLTEDYDNNYRQYLYFNGRVPGIKFDKVLIKNNFLIATRIDENSFQDDISSTEKYSNYELAAVKHRHHTYVISRINGEFNSLSKEPIISYDFVSDSAMIYSVMDEYRSIYFVSGNEAPEFIGQRSALDTLVMDGKIDSGKEYDELYRLKINDRYGIYSRVLGKWLLPPVYNKIDIGDIRGNDMIAFDNKKDLDISAYKENESVTKVNLFSLYSLKTK